MTILSTIQSACGLGIPVARPAAVFSQTDQTSIELAAIANDAADMIGSCHPWQKFSGLATITGDGSEEDFDLPTDYGWMPDANRLWGSDLQQPLGKVQSQDDWLGLVVRNFDTAPPVWIIYGDQVHIRAALANASTAKYFYQSNLIIAPATGSNKAAFTLDTDTFRLPERLLKLAIIYRWKQAKGLAYTQELDDFEVLKEQFIARDKGATILKQGSPRMPRDANTAFPMSVPIT